MVFTYTHYLMEVEGVGRKDFQYPHSHPLSGWPIVVHVTVVGIASSVVVAVF